MKKVILTIICIAFAANVPAQITVGSLGQIGIGMPMGTNPQYPLDVAGNARVAGNIYIGNIYGFLGTTNINSPLVFKVTNMMAGITGDFDNASNVSFGYASLNNSVMGRNTAIGYQALYSNTIASDNTALGYQALYFNTSGYSNTALGFCTLYSNTTGYGNVANGYRALYSNITGYDNVANGYYALFANTTGKYNTAIGFCALYSIAAGVYNTAVGYDAGTIGNLNNTTAIGRQARVTADNQVRLGNYTVTSAGGAVSWTTVSDGRAKRNIAADIPGLNFINRLQPVTYNLDLKAIDELTKSDDPKINAHGDSLQAAMSPEERRITEEARANKESKIYSGFIAQDVEKAAKKSGYDFSGVDAPENGKGPYGLRYAEFVVPLVKAVQELSEQNDALQQTVKEQQITIDKMKQQIEKLENR